MMKKCIFLYFPFVLALFSACQNSHDVTVGNVEKIRYNVVVEITDSQGDDSTLYEISTNMKSKILPQKWEDVLFAQLPYNNRERYNKEYKNVSWFFPSDTMVYECDTCYHREYTYYAFSKDCYNSYEEYLNSVWEKDSMTYIDEATATFNAMPDNVKNMVVDVQNYIRNEALQLINIYCTNAMAAILKRQGKEKGDAFCLDTIIPDSVVDKHYYYVQIDSTQLKFMLEPAKCNLPLYDTLFIANYSIPGDNIQNQDTTKNHNTFYYYLKANNLPKTASIKFTVLDDNSQVVASKVYKAPFEKKQKINIELNKNKGISIYY